MENKNIDKLVCEKVLGFKYHSPSIYEPTGTFCAEYYIDSEGKTYYDFSPSESMQDVWFIIEKLKQDEQYYFILQNGDYYDYECTFRDYFTKEEFIAEDDSAPMAICLSALKVRGVDINK